ncbi:MAG: PSD1 domain-containing protein [Pirellulales bacterium]|nr:PSD1 domain-containing protein [Pirellulales bacterium]
MVLAATAGALSGRAAQPVLPAASAEAVDFARDIRPIFERRCYVCHGPQLQESNYRLDRKEIALGVGDRGEPPIIVGDSANSPLVRFVAGVDATTHMPPEDEGEPLTAQEVSLLRAWIDTGAAWPAEAQSADAEERLTTDHWSLQPLVPPAIPLADDGWPTNAIDNFVLARLRDAQLAPSPQAFRRALIRRVYFDMHGLPPTPEQVAAFVSDERADAYERLIDDVLASPRYGERWGQHWLDVVRFSESNGFEMNQQRPNAWPYRDYVIEAFNSDKPYDQFIREQLAGDALGAPAATGFLVAGAWDQVKSPDVALTLMQRQDELADMTNTTGATFLGLTVGCARCHNHKFDPVLQKDYYALQAVFAGVQHGERPWPTDEDACKIEEPPSDSREPVIATVNEERFEPVKARAVRLTIRATNGGEPCLDELEVWSTPAADAEAAGRESARNVALATAGAHVTSSGDYAGNPKHQLRHVNDGKYGNDYSWISDTPGAGWVAIELAAPAVIERVTWGRDRLGAFGDRLATGYSIEIQTLEGQWIEVASSANRRPLAPAQPMVYAGNFMQPSEPTHRLFRGDPMSPKEIVAPDALTVLGTLDLAADAPEQQRRVALARWVASSENPLTARVMVNRLWHYHFGTGLVDTPSDFGGNGARPSHPELLDWLAGEFIESGWSVKHMHRLILLSSTYRQSNESREECRAVDAGTRLLWRFPPRRLEAEAIRDAVLQVSGHLDLTMGGPGWSAFVPNDNYVRVYEPKEAFGPAEWRRMVYMQRIRMRPDGVFGAFDAPDGGQTCPKRGRSITALQALNLLNSGFMRDQARLFAERLQREAGAEAATEVERAFELAFNRRPDEDESRAARELIESHGLPAFCLAVLNANELAFMP